MSSICLTIQRAKEPAGRNEPRDPACPFALFLTLLAPAPALILGALVMRRHELPTSVWAQNLAVGAIMSGISIALRKTPHFWRRPWTFIAITFAALLGTFVDSGLQDIHRWVHFGSIPIYTAAIFLPPLTIALGVLVSDGSDWHAAVVTLATLVILAAQPDAAQATAFGGAALVLVVPSLQVGLARLIFVLAVALVIAWAWIRPDPLPPVAHVEGIVGLAAGQGMFWAILALAALLLLPLPFVQISLREDGRPARALAIYVCGYLVASLAGNSPIPLLGYGASPVIGYYIALAWGIRDRKS
jgi:hypothetical protein